MNKHLIQLGCLVALAFPMASNAQENVDLAMMQKIRQEGLQNSKVIPVGVLQKQLLTHGVNLVKVGI